MGSGMARNLLRAGHSLIVYNRTPGRAQELAIQGAGIADAPSGVCDADAVLTMIADDEALEQVSFGEQGILAALRPGAIHASHSTISTALAQRLTAEHTSRNQIFVSAPVFGRPEAAANAQLVVVPAGDSNAIERLKPVFEAIGRQIVIAGKEPWQANALKLCGNFMLASMIEAFGEAFATMRKSGVEPRTFLEVILGLFRSPLYEMYGGIIAEQRFDPAGFALKLGLKDIRLTLRTADELASPMPFASVVHDQLLAAIASGQAELDWSSFTRIAARNAGLKD